MSVRWWGQCEDTWQWEIEWLCCEWLRKEVTECCWVLEWCIVESQAWEWWEWYQWWEDWDRWECVTVWPRIDVMFVEHIHRFIEHGYRFIRLTV